jgi:hypothetical protein
MAPVPIVLPKGVGYDSDRRGSQAGKQPNSGRFFNGGGAREMRRGQAGGGVTGVLQLKVTFRLRKSPNAHQTKQNPRQPAYFGTHWRQRQSERKDSKRKGGEGSVRQ